MCWAVAAPFGVGWWNKGKNVGEGTEADFAVPPVVVGEGFFAAVG